MKWKLQDDRPIYAQLVEQLERGILTGEYPPGSGIPSVRNLAVEAEVNPNTMQRALAELETRGLLHTHRTTGRTVTEDKKMVENLKRDLALAQIDTFFDGMRSIGIERNEALRLLTEAAESTKKEAVTNAAISKEEVM
jgi:DNA-binding transcriptional regulator YhcF (GntR family)